jgi:AcrR family transcriptional regulator
MLQVRQADEGNATPRTTIETTSQRRARQKLERRHEILDAAIALWATKGSRGTGLAEVAERAGMTHAGVLHHFGSKANLFLAVMEERDRRDRAILQPYFDRADIHDLWAHYPDIARSNEREQGLSQLFVVLIGESITPNNVGHEYLRDRYRLVRARTQEILGAAQQRGEIDKGVDCAATASQIVAFMDGALIQWLIDPRPGGLVTSYRHFFDGLAATIGLRPARTSRRSRKAP